MSEDQGLHSAIKRSSFVFVEVLGATGGLSARATFPTITPMVNLTPHRKRVRHFHHPGHCHELTFSCFHRLPLLTAAPLCRLLSYSIDRALVQHGFWLVAFVYMPEHVHLLVFPVAPIAQIERLLFAIKRPFSYWAKQYAAAYDSNLLQQLTVQERPGKMVFRFWQEGPEYDRNLVSRAAVLSAIDYIHHNPVRRGLSRTPGEWPWSSWPAYHHPREEHDMTLPHVHGIGDIL